MRVSRRAVVLFVNFRKNNWSSAGNAHCFTVNGNRLETLPLIYDPCFFSSYLHRPAPAVVQAACDDRFQRRHRGNSISPGSGGHQQTELTFAAMTDFFQS